MYLRYSLLLTILITSYLWSTNDVQSMHLFVSLCDNKSQGIVPVPEKIGNGDDAANNLYWGLRDGVKGRFTRSRSWQLVYNIVDTNTNAYLIERCIFKYTQTNFYLVADAYRGSMLKRTINDFLNAAILKFDESAAIPSGNRIIHIPLGTGASSVAYIGHNGLMDFRAPVLPDVVRYKLKKAVVLCCKSEQYFGNILRAHGAVPLLMTKQLMYPGAFILESALDGMLLNEKPHQLLERAAIAYASNQNISARSASGIFYAE